MSRSADTGESTAAIVARGDDRSWEVVAVMLLNGATLVRVPRLKGYYYTDDGRRVGQSALSATRVGKLERLNVLERVGVDRYGLTPWARETKLIPGVWAQVSLTGVDPEAARRELSLSTSSPGAVEGEREAIG